MNDSTFLMFEEKILNTTSTPNLDNLEPSSPIVDLFHENNIEAKENINSKNLNDGISESLKSSEENIRKELEKQSMFTSFGLTDIYRQKLTPKDEQFNFIFIVGSFFLFIMICVLWLKIKLSLNEE
jgi:hypothetical protein